jgi:ribosomal protein S18
MLSPGKKKVTQRNIFISPQGRMPTKNTANPTTKQKEVQNQVKRAKIN